MQTFIAHLPALAFTAHPDPMWVLEWPGPPGRAGRMIDVNRAALVAYGYEREAFLQLDLFDLRCPSGHAQLAAELEAPGAGADGRQALVWHRRRNGERFPVEIRSERLERDGRAYRLVLARDCSDLRVLERQEAHWRDVAGEAERLLYNTFDLVSDGVVLFDADQRYRYFNARAFELVGVTPEDDLIGVRIFERFPHRVGSPFHAAFQRVIATRQPEAVEELHPVSGLWLELRLYPARDGGLTVLLTDVTSRHQKATEMAERERDWRQLAEQVPAIIYRSQAESPYHTLWINPRVKDLGFTQDQWLADPGAWARLLHPEDAPRVMQDLLGSLATHGRGEIEYRMQAADGRWHWFRDASRIVVSHDGRERSIQGVMFDITHIRESEAALQASRQEMAELAHRLLVQEKETTRRLALALHDGIGQTLAVARLYLDDALTRALPCGHAVSAGGPADLLQTARRVEALLSTAIGEVRQTLVDLRPPLLDEQGLVAALDNEVRSVQAPGADPSIDLQAQLVDAGVRWPSEVEYGAFMVAREALSNAIRHARARHIVLRVEGGRDWLSLEVLDDGVGFIDPGPPDSSTQGRPGEHRLGVTGMRERASAIGARLGLEARPQGGRRVVLFWTLGAPGPGTGLDPVSLYELSA